MAWTFWVIEAGDMSTRSGRSDCVKPGQLGPEHERSQSANQAYEVNVGRSGLDGLENGLANLFSPNQVSRRR